MAIEVSRREFLGGLAVTFASAFARRLSAEAAANEPLLRFGALSDTHLRVTDDPDQLGRVFRGARTVPRDAAQRRREGRKKPAFRSPRPSGSQTRFRYVIETRQEH